MEAELLEVGIENARFYLDALIPGLAEEELDWRGIQATCASFRQRGVCTLLLDGTAEAFQANLMQSASAFAFFLGAATEEVKVTSEAGPFYDAIAGGYWDCAATLARNSRLRWNPEYEYEDDFLFVLFLMKHFFLDATVEECEAILSEHARAAEDAEPEKRELMRAFLDRDGDLFREALDAFLEQRSEDLRARVRRGALPEEAAAWRCHFSIEGLALVRLAERAGIPTDPSYLHVPAVARTNVRLPFDPDSWRTPDVTVPPRS